MKRQAHRQSVANIPGPSWEAVYHVRLKLHQTERQKRDGEVITDAPLYFIDNCTASTWGPLLHFRNSKQEAPFRLVPSRSRVIFPSCWPVVKKKWPINAAAFQKKYFLNWLLLRYTIHFSLVNDVIGSNLSDLDQLIFDCVSGGSLMRFPVWNDWLQFMRG